MATRYKAKKLVLENEDGWKDHTRDAFKQLNPCEEVCEIFGSVEAHNERELVLHYENTIINDIDVSVFYNNGRELTDEDISRLENVGNKNRTNRKGISETGFALRTIMANAVTKDLDIETITTTNMCDFSFFTGKNSSGVNYSFAIDYDFRVINSTNYKEADIFSSSKSEYMKLYSSLEQKYGAGVMVVIPKKIDEDNSKITSGLRLMFNKIPCKIFLNNVDITEKKSGRFLDDNYGNPYVEIEIMVHKVKEGKKKEINVIDFLVKDKANIHNDVDIKDRYCFKLKPSIKTTKDINHLFSYFVKHNSYEADIPANSPLFYKSDANIQTFKRNDTKSNSRKYYDHDDTLNRTGIKLYTNNSALSPSAPSFKESNNNVSDHFSSKVASDRGCTHGNSLDGFTFDENQCMQIDYNENNNESWYSKDTSLLNITAVKSGSSIKRKDDRDSALIAIPFLITGFAAEFLFKKQKKESKKKISKEQELENKLKAAEAEALQEQKAREAAEAKALQEQEAREAAEAKALQEQEAREAAEAKALQEQQEKEAAEAKALQEQQEKEAAEKLAQKAETNAKKEKEAKEAAQKKEREAEEKADQEQRERIEAEQRADVAEEQRDVAEEQRDVAEEQRDDAEQKYKKDKIPSDIRVPTWRRQFGKCDEGECPICETLISLHKDHKGVASCAHIISEKDKGPMDTINMIYLCNSCNSKHKKGLLTDYVKEYKSHNRYQDFISQFKVKDQLSELVAKYKSDYPSLLNLEEDLNAL
jgi:hypothetical protein